MVRFLAWSHPRSGCFSTFNVLSVSQLLEGKLYWKETPLDTLRKNTTGMKQGIKVCKKIVWGGGSGK